MNIEENEQNKKKGENKKKEKTANPTKSTHIVECDALLVILHDSIVEAQCVIRHAGERGGVRIVRPGHWARKTRVNFVRLQRTVLVVEEGCVELAADACIASLPPLCAAGATKAHLEDAHDLEQKSVHRFATRV